MKTRLERKNKDTDKQRRRSQTPQRKVHKQTVRHTKLTLASGPNSRCFSTVIKKKKGGRKLGRFRHAVFTALTQYGMLDCPLNWRPMKFPFVCMRCGSYRLYFAISCGLRVLYFFFNWLSVNCIRCGSYIPLFYCIIKFYLSLRALYILFTECNLKIA